MTVPPSHRTLPDNRNPKNQRIKSQQLTEIPKTGAVRYAPRPPINQPTKLSSATSQLFHQTISQLSRLPKETSAFPSTWIPSHYRTHQLCEEKIQDGTNPPSAILSLLSVRPITPPLFLLQGPAFAQQFTGQKARKRTIATEQVQRKKREK